MTHFAAVHISALKFLSVLSNTKFPAVSALCAFTRAKSPKMDSSKRYFLPLKIAVDLGLLAISTSWVPCLNFMGNPPY